jgi:hypothetical protein
MHMFWVVVSAVYVQVGQAVTFPCEDPLILKSREMTAPHYVWKNSVGEPFSPFRVQVSKDGVLTLRKVDTKDTNTYSCTKKDAVSSRKLQMRPYTLYGQYRPQSPPCDIVSSQLYL